MPLMDFKPLQHLPGACDVAALFEPGVPGDTDTHQVGDLLAAQAEGPSRRDRG